MASRKTQQRKPRAQRATSNVFVMFDQTQIQVRIFLQNFIIFHHLKYVKLCKHTKNTQATEQFPTNFLNIFNT